MFIRTRIPQEIRVVDARRFSLLIYYGYIIVRRRVGSRSVLLTLFCGQEVEISDQRTGADHTMVCRESAAVLPKEEAEPDPSEEPEPAWVVELGKMSFAEKLQAAEESR